MCLTFFMFQEFTYFFYFFTLSWLLPVVVMTFCYSAIILTIARSASCFSSSASI
jgi:hypothetical protein